jgi:hypothetical protein
MEHDRQRDESSGSSHGADRARGCRRRGEARLVTAKDRLQRAAAVLARRRLILLAAATAITAAWSLTAIRAKMFLLLLAIVSLPVGSPTGLLVLRILSAAAEAGER